MALSSFLEKWLVAYTTLRNAALSRPGRFRRTHRQWKVDSACKRSSWHSTRVVFVCKYTDTISQPCVCHTHDISQSVHHSGGITAPFWFWSCINGSSCFGVRSVHASVLVPFCRCCVCSALIAKCCSIRVGERESCLLKKKE